nr:MAG TPA: hypothetical protein [Caudoviricetes sp.]
MLIKLLNAQITKRVMKKHKNNFKNYKQKCRKKQKKRNNNI